MDRLDEFVSLDKLCAALAKRELMAQGEPLGIALDAEGWKLMIKAWMDEENDGTG